MKDPRMVKLAHNLVNYSCAVKPGEKVLIENIGLVRDFVVALVEAVYEAGGLPFVTIKESEAGCLQIGQIKSSGRGSPS